MKGFWDSKTDEEVFKALNVETLSFIGKFKQDDKFSFFENIRNLDYSPVLNLKSNIDDKNFVKVKILNKSTFELKNNTYYKITALVIPQKVRNDHESEFLYQFDDDSKFELYIPNEKEFTNLIYKKYSDANTANSQDILRSVKTITYQINKRNETFIYELLQNADDYPTENEKVIVNFYVNDKYLLFTHNGAKFNFNNIYSLCAINAEDKVDEIEKIGFKGIGFKSVFKTNDFVYLKSGNYSFSFDKSFYHSEYPWQLMPIWTELEDLEISLKNNDRFLKENVAIALRPIERYKTLAEYSEALELFNDERILLFLRNVERVNVFINNEKRIFCFKNSENWWLKEFQIEVSQEISEYLNNQILEGNEEVPSKFSNIKTCIISFAAKKKANKIVKLTDGKLFNYLPLAVSLNFSFLLNADFIPDGEREDLTENNWNDFLLFQAGTSFIAYIKETIEDEKLEVGLRYSILNLIPSFQETSELLKNQEKWNSFFISFKTGFEHSVKGYELVKPNAFIPTQESNIVPISEILIDETGIAKLLGISFSELTGIKENLIHEEVGEGIFKIKALIDEYNIGKIFTVNDLKDTLKNIKFQEWLKITENNFKLIEHFFNSANSELNSLLDTEAIILSESGNLCKCAELYFSLPSEVLFLGSSRINSELKDLCVSEEIELKLKTFKATDYFKENISKINSFLTSEKNILEFWHFIYDNWNEFNEDIEIKAALRTLNIICKPVKNGIENIQIVSTVYVPKELANEDEVETIIEKLKIENKYFILPNFDFVKRPNKNKIWTEIFRYAQAKVGLKDLIPEVIKNLAKLNKDSHFKACLEIFKYWKSNAAKETKLSEAQIKLIELHLKIKCIDREYRNTKDCYISDNYSTNPIISTIIPEIELNNQISNEYGSFEWNEFFKTIGCKPLEEKQLVLELKLKHFVVNQEKYRDRHFDIIKSLSLLHESRIDYSLNFDKLKASLSDIKLKTYNDEFIFPKDIHLSDNFEPKLKIGNIDQADYKVIHPNYFEIGINKMFLIILGLNENFKLLSYETLNMNMFSFESKFIQLILKLDDFEKVKLKFAHRPLADVFKYTEIKNYCTINYLKLATIPEINNKFWQFLKNECLLKINIKIIVYNRGGINVDIDNRIVFFLKNNNACKNQLNELKRTIDLYAFKFSKYINDKSILPFEDLSGIYVGDERKISLEEVVGINTKLSPKLCIDLLVRVDQHLTKDEIIDLKIIEILKDYKPVSEEEKDKLLFPNQSFEWRPIKELAIFDPNEVQLDESYQLHNDFIVLAENFGIPKITKKHLNYIIEPNSPSSTSEIIDFFKDKIYFISYKIDRRNWKELGSKFIEDLNEYSFFSVISITQKIDILNIDFNQSKSFIVKDKEIYFTNEWNSNNALINWIVSSFFVDNITINFFQNIITATDKKICQYLEFDGKLPSEPPFNGKKPESENFNSSEDEYVKDLKFDIEELKEFYPLDILIGLEKHLFGHSEIYSEERKNALNDLVKLKFLRLNNIEYDKADMKSNRIKKGDLDYIFHSARGNFAYINFNEIIDVNNGCKMVIDFGRGLNSLKEYTFEELLKLNYHHIYYQENSGNIDDVFQFISNNSFNKNMKMLLIDPDKKIARILNVMNKSKIENTEAQIDSETSSLI